MTYQEIIQEIESLPIEQQNSLIKLIRQQQHERQDNSINNLTAGCGDSISSNESTNDRSIYRATERTPEQTAEGLQKIERMIKYKQDLWNNMTEEERNISDAQFAMLDEYLKESRC